ncbi:LPD38 domain-containing protein [Aeromonas veronii]
MDKPGLRDALPQPKLSDTRTDPFWSNLDSSLSAAAAQSAAQTPQRDLDVGLGDVARGVGAGALELVGGIGELARQASQFGKENAGKQGGDYLEQARANMASKLSPVLDVVAGAGDLAKSGAESLTEGMSGDAKEAIGRSLIDETPEGRLTMGDGAGDLDVWAMKMAQGVGSMVPTLLAGGVTGAAAKASIGRAVTTSMLKRGATQEVAEAVAAKTVAKLATGAAVTTGATGSVGSAGVNTRESVLGMSFDELSRSDTFRQAFTRIDQDQQTQHLSDEEKLSLAREETANVASRATMSDAKVWGAAAMGSVMGDAMLFKMLAGKAATGGVLKGAAKGAVGEGIGETLEEGVQQYTINESLNEVAAAGIDPMKGVVSSALEGGLIGMGTGGALGGAGGLRGSKSQPESEGGAQVDPATVEDVAPVEQGDPMQANPAAAPADPDLAPAADAMADPVVAPSGEQSPLGPSASQFDELRDVPAYLRRDDTAERFKGMAADSEVQRALAGEFGQSVQELVASQMQAGDQGKSLYERAQAGELGLDPFAGNKSAQQVAMENQRPALPLKDVIFAGDANAARGMTKEGHFDDKQAGTGPQFRGAERTRWQSGQEGDVLPPEASSTKPAGELPGAVIDGEAREVGTELPHRDVVYGADQRQPDAKPMRGSATESAVGPLQTLRITRKGKPFATEKEAAMASRNGKEMPVPLNGGGFGVAEIAEVEQVKAAATTQPSAPQLDDISVTDQNQPSDQPAASVRAETVPAPSATAGEASQLAPAIDTGYREVIPVNQPQAEVSNEPVTPVPAISSEGQGDQPGAGEPAAAGAGPAIAGLADRAGSGNPADNTPAPPVPDGQQQDDPTLTAPAPDAGAAVSGRIGEDELRDRDLLKEHGGHWKYRSAAGAGWFTANTKEAAIERAEEAYRKAVSKGEPVPTRDERFAQADAELFSEMDRRYGKMSTPELEAEYQRLGGEVGDLQKSGSGEFNGNGGRRTGAAVSNEGARQVGEERLRLGVYMKMRRDRDTVESGAKSQQIEPANDWSGAKSAADYHAAKRRLFSGEMEFSEFQAMSRSALDNAPSLRAELEKKTKQDLLDQLSRFNAARYKNDKKAVVVEAAYNQLIGDLRWAANSDGNTISETYAIGGARQSIEERVAKALDGLTPERYQLFRDKQLSDVAEMQRRREELKQSLTDPQTLDDFKAFIERRGIDKLTQEQRARYEDMVAARNLDRREQERSAKGNETAPSTTSSDIIKTKHTKTGDDLFVVQMGDRVERDAYNRINAHAKTMGGWYSSFRGKGAVPGFQFKSEEKATEFRAWLGGEVGGASPEVAPDQSTDSEAQPAGKSKQVEALRNRAASARAKAEAVFNADRKENTARRASMAANARANAERDLRFAGLLEAIATGIESGEITYLRNLANGAQLEELQSALNRGLWSLPATKIDALVSDGVINRDDSSRYSWSDKATPEQMVEGVSMPGMDYHTDRIREVALKMQGASGFKQAGAKVMSLVKAAANRDNKTTTLSDPELIAKLKAYVTGSDDYSTSTIKDQIAGYGRLERMGITNHTELRAALRELVRLQRGLNETAPQRDPVTEKTNALKRRLLNNRNAFIDFFPTPEEYAADLVDRLGIEPGMVVLEPSAGHGMLAEAARDAGATVEAVELAGDLRDILQEKGFSLVGNDFMETTPSQRYDAVIMNPPFSNDMDIDHVRHAFAHLKPGGRLAAIVSSMAGQRSNKKNKAFREWLDDLGASEEMMPEGAFKDSLNPTSVRTKIITIEKPVDSIANSDSTEQRAVSFSKQAMAQGEKPAKHLTRKEAELVTKEWFKQYRGASGIDVQIHATQAELEKALGLAAKDGLIRRAAFDDDNGTLHVAADTIANPKRMREILRHEVLAHYGLANVLGDGEYTKLISRIIKSKSAPSMKAVWDWVDTHYAGEDVGVQAEEVIAHLAELEQSAWRRGWDQVVAWVTKALRTVGFVPGGITAAETRVLIEGLGKKMKRGGPDNGGPDGGQKFSQEADKQSDPFTPNMGEADAYRQQLKNAMSSLKSGEIVIEIGHTPAVLRRVGAPDLPLRITRDIVRKATNGVKHDVPMHVIEKMPELLHDPVAVFDSRTESDAKTILVDAVDTSGRPVITAIHLNAKAGRVEINRIASVYGKDNGIGAMERWIDEGLLRYAREKQNPLGTTQGLQLPKRGSPERVYDSNILTKDDIRKGGLKMSQANTAADKAMEKLNLGPKPDIIDNTKANLAKLRKVDRGVVESWVDRFIKKANTEVLDALAPIKYAEDAAGITDAADSGYVAARMATGAASTMQATMLYGLPEWKDGVIQRKAGTGEKDALLGIFSDLGADLHNWLGWMAGHRAELLIAQGRENLLDANDIAALKGQGKGKEAKFLDAKARWNRLNAATLDLAQEAGLFTKEERAEFESEWYIPFFRETEDGDVIAPFKPKGIANQNAGIKKLKGGEANTNDLLENIFTSTSKLIDASMKNMAAQKTVWNLADTGLIEVVAKPNMMDWRALKNGKDLITVKLEGEDYMILVEDPDLYRAMTFFDRQPFGTMINMASKAKRLLTAGVTASPEFMLRNFLRDSLSSWAISKDGFKPVIDSIKGVKKTLAMDGSTIDVMFSGASFLGGYVNGNDPGAMADTVRKSLRRKGMTPEQIARYEKSIIRNAAHAKGVVADAWEKYSRYGEALENANREAVYAAAIKAGKSHAQAAFESKDLMDFSMLGAARAIQGASLVLPFFNARLQGLGKLSRELRDNPREIAKRAGMITAMSLGLLAANWDDERYEELPDWDKDANWHFFVGDQHFRIPKPFEIGVMFGTIPERMVRAMGDKDTGAQFGKAVARAIGDTFALNPTPQIIKPLVEAAFNYDTFRGGPIDSPQDLAVKAEARYNEQTSLLMRELGELSGFSPKQLEHLVIGYTGTIGGYVMATADGLIRASRPGESASWRADEIPLVKAVYRGTGPAKSTQHMEEFYRMLSEVNQLKRTVDQYRSEGLDDKANELLEEQGGILKSRRSLSRTQQQVRVVRNKIELIQRDRTMNAEEKRKRIDELLARRNDLVYQAVNKNRENWE